MIKKNEEQPENKENLPETLPLGNKISSQGVSQDEPSSEPLLEVQVEVEEFGKKPAKKRGSKATEEAIALAESGNSEFVEKVVSINRITKVTKGGKKLSFSALVVVGDTKGNVGYSLEKAGEVSIAIRKAMASAKRNMIHVPMNGTTIPHEIIGQCGGSRVLLKPASDGTGVIASGAVRAVCDGAGIRNILTKCHRSNNPINVVKATVDGFHRLKTQRSSMNKD